MLRHSSDISRSQRSSSASYRPVAAYRPTGILLTTDHTYRPAATLTLKYRLRFAIIALILAFLGIHFGWSMHVSAEASASRIEQQREAQAASARAKIFASQMQALIAANPQITFSISLANQSVGVQTYGNSDVFDGASVGKLLTAADYLHHVETRGDSLTQKIDGTSAQTWLRSMIVDSDDTAWAELNSYLGHDDLANYATNVGFTNYDPSQNTFTSADVAALLYKLQNRSLLNNADRSLLLGYMQRANYRQYIVPAIPAGDSVYHKIGLDNDEVNDAAIITKDGQSFELVIFSNGNGSYDWADRAMTFQTITKDALQAFLP